MYTIYGYSPSFTTRRVLYTAEAVGLEFNYVHIDIIKGEQKTNAHLNRHPLGKTPVLETENGLLIESHAIARYLASFANTDFYPMTNPWKKAQIDQWCEFIIQGIGKELITYLYENFLKEYFKMGSKNEEILKTCKKQIDKYTPHLEVQLENFPYVAGREFTLADIIAWSYFETCERSGYSFEDYPNIIAWAKEMKVLRPISKVRNEYKLWEE
jgi:glutathione S-transferase